MEDLKIERRRFLAAGSTLVGFAVTDLTIATAIGATTTAEVGSAEFSPLAKWIGRALPAAPANYRSQASAPMLRRSFNLPGAVRSAKLTIASFGYYDAEINGRRVSEGVLDPPMSQFDKTVLSRTLDVATLLQSGPNALGLMLGRSYVTGIAGPGAPWVSEPRVLAQLDVILADGTTQQIVTDAAWKLADSPIHDWMYFGERYDARREVSGWTLPDFDDGAWSAAPVQPAPTVAIVPAAAPEIVIVDTWAPLKVTEPTPGTRVYDFGKITAGWARIRVRGPAGAKVELRYGQQLKSDGTVYLTVPLGSKDLTLLQHEDHYILNGGGRETWEPRFTRHGFQFVEVIVTGGPLSEFAIDARENHTPATSTGAFECGNEVINRLHANHRRSILLNHWGFPTDTSWRDRQGWTADSACYLDSTILNYAGLQAVYVDWLRAVRDAQQPDGSIVAFAPNTMAFPAFNDPSWGGMIVLIPWVLYWRTGDRAFLSDNYPAASRWMKLMESKIAASGQLWDGFSFGDHSSPGSEAGGTLALTPKEKPTLSATAHLYREARVLAQIAELLGKRADADRFEAMADRILPAFNAAFLDKAKNVYVAPEQGEYRQTSNLMPLAFDMVPAAHREAVFANLVADIEARGRHLNTGAVGTKLILPVLTHHGRPDLAYALMAQTSYPSWGYWVTQGATSSWETWRNEGPEQTLDHPFLGSFDEWLFEHLAGIQAAGPGYSKIRLVPVIPEGLDHASAKLTTPRGEVSCAWRRNGQTVTLGARLPPGAATEIVLPARSEQISAQDGQLRLVKRDGKNTIYTTVSPHLVINLMMEEKA